MCITKKNYKNNYMIKIYKISIGPNKKLYKFKNVS